MTTQNLSFIISVTAVVIAAFALGWNSYRDVILKAKVKVSCGVFKLYHPDIPNDPSFIKISATNFGPGRVKIMNIVIKDARWWKRIIATIENAIITPDFKNPFSGTIPSWIEVGDKLDLLLPYTEEAFLSGEHTHVGVCDFFGRFHWAPKSDVVEAKRESKETFQSTAG